MWINLLKTSKPWYLKSRDKFDVNSQRSSTRYVVALSLSLNVKCKRRENSSNVNCYCAREIFFPRIIFHNFQLHCFDCNVKRRKWNEILGKKLCPRFLLSLSPPPPFDFIFACARFGREISHPVWNANTIARKFSIKPIWISFKEFLLSLVPRDREGLRW